MIQSTGEKIYPALCGEWRVKEKVNGQTVSESEDRGILQEIIQTLNGRVDFYSGQPQGTSDLKESDLEYVDAANAPQTVVPAEFVEKFENRFPEQKGKGVPYP